MPALAAGTAGYQGANATAAVQRALKAGFTHLHTAFDYFNLVPLGLGLRGVPRSSYFLSSMTSPCIHPAAPPKRNVTDPQGCHDLTITEVQSVLDELKLPTLDLLMLHGPSEAFGHIGGCSPLACALARAQWSAYETLLTSGKVRAIGVSNFCQSCLACLNGSKFAPAVNQIQVHVGQGSADPGPSLLSYCVSTRARRHEFAMPSMKDCLAGWLAACLPACLPACPPAPAAVLHPQSSSAVPTGEARHRRSGLRASRRRRAGQGQLLRGHWAEAQQVSGAGSPEVGAATSPHGRRARGLRCPSSAGFGPLRLFARRVRPQGTRRADAAKGRGGRTMFVGVHGIVSATTGSECPANPTWFL